MSSKSRVKRPEPYIRSTPDTLWNRVTGHFLSLPSFLICEMGLIPATHISGIVDSQVYMGVFTVAR